MHLIYAQIVKEPFEGYNAPQFALPGTALQQFV